VAVSYGGGAPMSKEQAPEVECRRRARDWGGAPAGGRARLARRAAGCGRAPSSSGQR
jgi:hypothetical protein